MIDPYDKEQQALRDLYCNIMMEVRHRIEIVGYAARELYNIPKIAAYELCYLQFRLVCELIALSSLAAHGDIPATKSGRLTKTYQADAILNMLEKLHPDFYPVPSKQLRDANGKVLEIEEIKSGFLTKKELITLYHETGDLLHRGAMRDYKPRTAGDFRKILATLEKITTLLNHHQIQLSDPDYQLWVLMKTDIDDQVHAYVFQKIAGPPPRSPPDKSRH
jgi:hypothetical protein